MLVIFSHCHWVSGHPAWMDSPQFRSLGALGVRSFFVISGFLITLLMLRESAKTGTIDLKGFYFRRVLRILPVYFAFLFVVLILQAATKLSIPLDDWLACMTFTRNFFGSTWITGHLWSLGIEQQFYLIWPLAFIFSKPHVKSMRGCLVLLFPLLVCPLFRAGASFLGGDPYFSIFSFFLQADALAVGCLTALILWHFGPMTAGILSRHRWWIGPLALLLILLPLQLSTPTLWWFLIGCASPQIQAWGVAILLVLAMEINRWRIFGFLDTAPMAFMGVISYSLYVWQQLFCTKPASYGGVSSWWNSFPYWMLAAFLAAVASHYLVERPFLRLKRGESKHHKPGMPTPAPQATQSATKS